MTNVRGFREQGIGPFEYDDAVDLIRKFALALTNLGLNGRFSMMPTPRRIVENEKRADGRRGRTQIFYQIILVDKQPDEPYPEGLTALQIATAESRGYQEPKVKHYTAFGESMTLNQWAKAVGVTWPTLKSRIDAGMTMEEAITQIALKKVS